MITPSAYEALAEEVLSVYDEAELVMVSRLARRLERGIDEPGWTERKYAETAAYRKEMRAVMDDLKAGRNNTLKRAINEAYGEGANAMRTEAEMFSRALLSGNTIVGNVPKVTNLLSEMLDKLNAADRVILRDVDDAYADIVAKATARVASGTVTVRQAVSDELKTFADHGISSFMDKAGRTWQMSTYAEMATLTGIANATLKGYTDTMKSYGFDLAIISSHMGACPLCVAWEGVVVSISGDTQGYPSLTEAESGGAFHPRCLHSLSTYYEGVDKGGRRSPREVAPETPNYSTRVEQRSLERKVRAWKRRMSAAIQPDIERDALAHVRYYQGKLRDLTRNAPGRIGEYLPRKYYREGGRAPMLSAEARKLKPVRVKGA